MESSNLPQCTDALASLDCLKQAKFQFYKVLERSTIKSGERLCTRFDLAYNNLVDVIADLAAAYIRNERIRF